MSAPAGWHLQPDGQERYWDGSQWTDQFRAPLPSDPTAPPLPPSWAAPVDETQALDVDSTQAFSVPYAPEQPSQPGDHPPVPTPTEQGYAYPPAGAGAAPTGYPQTGYPQTGYPQTGYGAPGGQPYAPPPRQGKGLATGCLIAALVGLLVLGVLVVGAIFAFNRASDTISRTFPSGFPTELPSGFPSDGSTDGLGRAIDISVGDGFDLPRASVESGWGLEAAAGGSVVNITAMTATLTSGDRFPVLFALSFPDASGGQVQTVCTASSGTSGDTVDVSCVPLVGDVADATQATVIASL